MMKELNRCAVEEEKNSQRAFCFDVKEETGKQREVRRARPTAWSLRKRSFGKTWVLTVVGAGGGGGA